MVTQRRRILAVVLATLTLTGSYLSTARAADGTPSAAPATAPVLAAATTPVLTHRTAPLVAGQRVPRRPVAVTSPSGAAAPTAAVRGWRPVYVEDFPVRNATGTFPSAGYQKHWDVYADGWKDTSHNGTYMPSQVLSVHDGVLDYDIHSAGGKHLVAAPWLTDTAGTRFGRYSIRFRADELPGYKTAWLLWPDSERWPQDGEIDFPEADLGRGDTISAFSHHASARGGQDQYATKATAHGWHTATVEWVPGKVTFFLDGAHVGTSTTMVPSTAMHWVLQTETALDGTAPASTVRGHVLVDWVAFWARA